MFFFIFGGGVKVRERSGRIRCCYFRLDDRFSLKLLCFIKVFWVHCVSEIVKEYEIDILFVTENIVINKKEHRKEKKGKEKQRKKKNPLCFVYLIFFKHRT